VRSWTSSLAFAAPIALDWRPNMNNLDSAVDWFLDHFTHNRKLSHHTLKPSRRDLSHFRAFTAARSDGTPLSSIDRHAVRHWLGSMSSVKPRTVRRRLATVKSMFSGLERHGDLEINPLAGFRSEVKVGKSLPRIVGRNT